MTTYRPEKPLHGLIVALRKSGHKVFRVSGRQHLVRLWGAPRALLLTARELRAVARHNTRPHPTLGVPRLPRAQRPPPPRPREPTLPGLDPASPAVPAPTPNPR